MKINKFLIKNNITPTLQIKNEKGKSIFICELIEKYLIQQKKQKNTSKIKLYLKSDPKTFLHL